MNDKTESMEKRNGEIRKGKRIQTNIRLPERMKDDICRETDKSGLSMNDYMLLAIREYLRGQT